MDELSIEITQIYVCIILLDTVELDLKVIVELKNIIVILNRCALCSDEDPHYKGRLFASKEEKEHHVFEYFILH
jgi:hypothetical protein